MNRFSIKNFDQRFDFYQQLKKIQILVNSCTEIWNLLKTASLVNNNLFRTSD